MQRILFLTTAHKYDDDRIFYHQAKYLHKKDFSVKICSLCSDFCGEIEGIEVESFAVLQESSKIKTALFLKVCNDFKPDCIICSEPLAVISAEKFAQKIKKVSIIYDITEWYPSFRMLTGTSFFSKTIQAIKFFLIQLYAGFCSTSFIFGEDSKKFPLAYIFPFKEKLILPYYPDDIFINKSICPLKNNKITLCYTGRISKEDGIGHFFKAADRVRKKNIGLHLSILIVGTAKRAEDQPYFQSLLEFYKWEDLIVKKTVPFREFSKSYSVANICFDLRERNFEYNRSLPIKIFYYLASGKPVIYTNLNAIENHMDISRFGYAVDPEDSETISEYISGYLNNSQLYMQHAENARKEYEEKYNWNIIRDSFLNFVQQSLK